MMHSKIYGNPIATPFNPKKLAPETPSGGGQLEGTFLNLGYDSANIINHYDNLNDYVTPGVYRYSSPNATVGTSKISNVPDTGINKNTGGFRLIVSELSSNSDADINSFMQTIIFDTPDYSTLQIWTRVHSKYGSGSGWSPWFKSLTTSDVQTMIDAAGGVGGSGEPGITPHIGDNGNWFIGETDTGKPSRGQDGKTPVKGADYFTPGEIQEIAEQAAGMVDVPEGGGVSSWNDLTDKPFYTGDPVETEVFNLSTALFQDDEPVWEQLMPIDDTTYLWVSHPETLEQVFEVGKEYTVVIDGVEHKTTAIDSAVLFGEVGPEVGLGDIEFLLSDTLPDSFQYAIHEIDDYGYPYFHIWYKGETAPTEFKVLCIKPEIVKIDPKYLPDGGVGYVTEGEYVVLREERTFEVTGNPELGYLISRNLVLTDGETYRVTFNGVVYDCVAYRDPDDATIVYIGGDSEPFKMQSQFGWCHLYPTEAGNHTVKIEGKQGLVYHKIDPRFLPDGFASIDDVYNIVDEALGVIENGTY